MNEIVRFDDKNIIGKIAENETAGIYLATLSEGSRRTMEGALNIISGLVAGVDRDLFPWDQLRYKHAVAIRARLAEGYNFSTVNKILCALRGVLKQAYLSNLMSIDDYQKLKEIKGIRGETLPRGRSLTLAEIQALFRVCVEDGSPAGVRDGAVFAVGYGAGLRRSEFVSLSLEDYNQETGVLQVLGKGNKENLSHLKNGGSQWLEAWIELRGDEPGPLFLPVSKGGRIQNDAMSDQAIYYICKKRGSQAGIKDFSPHDLRRTFISHLLEAGADISTVSKMVGHKKIETTTRYDMRGEEAKAKASELLHVPYYRKP